MRRKSLFLCALMLLAVTALVQAAELRVRPHRLNPNGKRARMKAEIYQVEPGTVNTESITMNGVAAIKTRVTPRKVIAFFYKKEVVATLGEVKKGQVHTITVEFNAGAQPSSLTDEIKIVGKRRKK